MKKTIYILTTVAALTGFSACNSKTEEHTTETTTTTDAVATDTSGTATSTTGDTTAATGAAGSDMGPMPLDAEFAKMAASGGILEVQLGKVASSNAAHADVKAFGEMMSTDHTGANTQLKKVATDKKMDLPTTMSAEHQATYDRLSKLKGAEFDKAYMSEMVKDHQKDVSMFQNQADKGTDADLKKFAQSTLPVLKAHLEKATAVAGTVGATTDAAAAHSSTGTGGH